MLPSPVRSGPVIYQFRPRLVSFGQVRSGQTGSDQIRSTPGSVILRSGPGRSHHRSAQSAHVIAYQVRPVAVKAGVSSQFRSGPVRSDHVRPVSDHVTPQANQVMSDFISSSVQFRSLQIKLRHARSRRVSQGQVR